MSTFERQAVIQADPEWVKYSPDASMERIAGVTKDGRAVVKDVNSGQSSEYLMTNVLDENVVQSLNELIWSRDGSTVAANWYGSLTISESSAADKPTQQQLAKQILLPSVFNSVSFTGPIEASNNARLTFAPPVWPDEKPMSLVNLDLNSLHYHPTPEIAFFKHSLNYKISPDGKKIALVCSDSPIRQSKELTEDDAPNIEQFNSDMQKIRIIEFESGRLIQTLEAAGPITSFSWTQDSKLLVVDSWKKEVEKKLLERVVATHNLETGNVTEMNPGEHSLERRSWSNSSRMSFPGTHGIQLVDGQVALQIFPPNSFSTRGRRVSLTNQRELDEQLDQIGIFDVATGNLKEIIPLGRRFQNLKFSWNREVVVSAGSWRSNSTTRTSFQSVVLIDRKRQNEAQVLNESLSRDNSIYLSPIANLFAIKKSGGFAIIEYDSVGESFNKTYEASDNNLRQMRWHRSKLVFGCTMSQTACLYDHGTKSMTTVRFANAVRSLIDTPTGWTIQASNTYVVDPNGKLLKTVFATTPMVPGENGRFDQFVTRDGDYLKQDSSRDLRVIQLNGNRFETRTVSDFDQKNE